MDVAYLCGRTFGRQRVLVGAPDGAPDPAVVERVVREPGLELVGFHCRPDGDVERSVRRLFSAMRAARRDHGKFLTEVHLTFDSDPVTAFVDDALDAACAATRLARPRVVLESGCSAMTFAGVTACRVASVISPADSPRIVVVDAGVMPPADGVVALANRHPLSPRASHRDGRRAEIARDVCCPATFTRRLLAVARCAPDGIVAVRRRPPPDPSGAVDEMLARDLGYSARRHDQHVGGLTPTVTRWPGELPGLRAAQLRVHDGTVGQLDVHPRDRPEERHRLTVAAPDSSAVTVTDSGRTIAVPAPRRSSRPASAPTRRAAARGPPKPSRAPWLFSPTNSATNGVAGLA